MWHSENPTKIFNYLYSYDETKSFQLICLMKKDKYESLPLVDRQIIETLNNPDESVSEVKINKPNDPIQLMDGKFLVFKV